MSRGRLRPFNTHPWRKPMTLDPQRFTVYDIQAFPIVITRNDAIVPGYAEQWEPSARQLLLEMD